jgi:hypothetical protein
LDPKPYEFGHSRLTVQEGRLRFLRGSKATVLICAESLGGCRQLCQLTVNPKTGAIYAQFTYFSGKRGVVLKARCPIDEHGKSRIEFSDRGLVSSALVKYSHPPDGRAHFSQDGQVETKVWADAMPLNGPQGHLFEIHAYDLTAFEPLWAGKERKSRVYLPFATVDSPRAALVVVEWRRKDGLEEFAKSRGKVLGPIDEVPRLRDGQMFTGALWAPPAECPLQDHVLLVAVHIIDYKDVIKDPMLLLLGGWTHPPQSLRAGTTAEFLAFKYPVADDAEFARHLGTIDLPNSRGDAAS